MEHQPPKFIAFTMKAEGRIRDIISDCNVLTPHDPQKPYHGKTHNSKALWDTGATNCVITPKTVKALNLKPITQTIVHYGGGEDVANVYLINIILPNSLQIPFVKVTECAENDKFGVIIGMDVITLGDFSVTNVEGKSTISFRFPSLKTIDYVEEFNETNKKFHTPIVINKPVGRNDPCPCGSGKKHKHCHGKLN